MYINQECGISGKIIRWMGQDRNPRNRHTEVQSANIWQKSEDNSIDDSILKTNGASICKSIN
jgi:hypothetical protein